MTSASVAPSENASSTSTEEHPAGHSDMPSSTSSAGAAAATAMGSVLGLGLLAAGLAL